MPPLEQTYGFVAVYRDADVPRFLLVEQESGWSFPKGHLEDGETPVETARRELLEETGVSDAEVMPEHSFSEEYIFPRNGVPTQKKNIYFLALLPAQENIRPQEGEIRQCRFVSYDEALPLLSDNRKRILSEAKAVLDRLPRTEHDT